MRVLGGWLDSRGDDVRRGRGGRRAPTAAAWALTVLVGTGVGWFAGRATFVPPQVAEGSAPVQTFTVADGTVGSSTELTATASWPVSPSGSGAGSGTITSVGVTGGATVSAGDVLYTLDLRPVVIAQGAVPAFRDLGQGATGADVAQLEQFLVGQGLFSGTPDERFTASTAAAVRQWQRRLGVEQSGFVGAGDLVFAAELPARVVLDPQIKVGAVLSGGEPVLGVAAPLPQFVIVANPDQRSSLPTTGTAVRVEAEGQVWDAVVGDIAYGDAELILTLTALDGGAVCGEQCGLLPFTTDVLRYPAIVEEIPEVTGPMVPLSAVGSDAGGSAYVTTPDGHRIPVSVVASDGSRSVVEGVEVGDVVALFAVSED